MIIVGLKADLRASSPCFIYNSTCWACQVQAGFPLVFSEDFLLREPAFAHDAQFPIHLTPVPDWQSPFLGGFKSRQIKRFYKGCIAWEYAPLTVQLSIGGIQRFNGICRINDFPYFRGKLEDWADYIPVLLPAFHAIRVLY